MVMLGFPISLGLFLVVSCFLAKYLKRRAVFPRLGQSAPQPILGILQVPQEELAETRHFAPLYPRVASPVIVHRRQFSAPGSPNQQLLLLPRRQAPHGHRRPPYRNEYPISTSLPSTPFLPSTPSPTSRNSELYGCRRIDSLIYAENAPREDEFTTRLLAGPPRSPLACRLGSSRVDSPIHAETARPSPVSPLLKDAEFTKRLLAGPPRSPLASRLNSRVDTPVHAENGLCSPVSPFLDDVEFTKRLLAGPPRSPLVGSLPPRSSPVARVVSDSPVGLFAEHQHPPRSPLVPTPSSAAANKSLAAQGSPAGLFVERFEHDLTSPHPIEPVLPSPELSYPQTMPSDALPQSIASTSPLLPSPIPADHFAAPFRPQRQTVRRVPSRPRSPAYMPESNSWKTSKKMGSHSMEFPSPASPATSPIRVLSPAVADSESPTLASVLPCSEEISKMDSNVSPRHALDSKAAAGETVEERLPLADVHNTPPPVPTLKKDAVDGQASKRRSALGSPTKIPIRIRTSSQIAALFSPTKVSRRVADDGPSPVYLYCSDTPVAVVTKSTVRSAQCDFENFSATLGARFKQKGWAAIGPNELTLEKKKGKKKKRVVGAKDAHAN
ncbi:hypothetical protein C8R45DRAFT_1062780 [Mycena sanguinolenta]|nr:hypothetical protein C8R45DRAFT_1062780 [Mycena sanguinolenta]